MYESRQNVVQQTQRFANGMKMKDEKMKPNNFGCGKSARVYHIISMKLDHSKLLSCENTLADRLFSRAKNELFIFMNLFVPFISFIPFIPFNGCTYLL